MTHGLRKRRSIRNTVQLLRDFNKFTANLVTEGKMTPELWAQLYGVHERTNKQITVLAERPKKEEIEKADITEIGEARSTQKML